MASKNNSSNLTMYLAIAVLAGGVVGYLVGQSSRPLSANYMSETASMMRDNGGNMMQMGKMM